MRFSVSNIFVFFSLIILLSLYNNCAPSFNSSSSGDSVEQESEFSGSPNSAPVSFSEVGIINKSKFSPFLSQDGQQFNLSCQDLEKEMPERFPGKLTKSEIQNSLADILGISLDVSTMYPPITPTDVFDESNRLVINETFPSQIQQIANSASQKFITSIKDKSNKIWSCNLNTNCIKQLSENLPNYLWRKNLSNKELQLIDDVTSNYGESISNKEDVVKNLIEFLITAPQFYIKNTTTRTAVSGSYSSLHEIAERMSLFLINSIPPLDLTDKLSDGSIKNRDDLFEYAEGMLGQELYQKRFVNNFLGKWFYLDLGKDDDSLFDRKKVSELANNEIGRLVRLFNENRPLSDVIDMGGKGIFNSKFFAKQTHSKDDDSSPVHRGLYVLETMMCYELPGLNPAVEEQIQEVQNSAGFPKNGTNLEQLAYHRTNPACASCHNIIDPSAIGLETFGPFGKRRTTYPNGEKIEFDEEIAGQRYTNTEEYINILSKTIDHNYCFSKKLHQKISPIPEGVEFNSCFMTSVFQNNKDLGMKDLVLNAVKSELMLLTNKPKF